VLGLSGPTTSPWGVPLHKGAERQQSERLLLVRDDSPTQIRTTLLQKIELPIGYGFSDLLRNASRLSALISGYEVDLVHLHTVRAGLLGCVACLFSGTPIVYTGHSWRFLQKDSFLQKSLFYLIEQFICRKADAITFSTEDDHALGKKYRFPINGKWRIVRTRIDRKDFAAGEKGIRKVRERWGISPSDFVVGNVSHLSVRKDPRTFLLAAAEIVGKVPNARFLWVGDGSCGQGGRVDPGTWPGREGGRHRIRPPI
jgi:glycosyltransferase involved in cell wall biosynthesis